MTNAIPCSISVQILQAGRSLICLIFYTWGAVTLVVVQPHFAGIFTFIWLYFAWLSWAFGVRSCVNVYDDHIEIQNPFRTFESSWSALKDVAIGSNIVFTSGERQRFVSALYTSTPMIVFMARHTRLFHKRDQLLKLIDTQRRMESSGATAEQVNWSIRWSLPTRRFFAFSVVLSLAFEVTGLLVQTSH